MNVNQLFKKIKLFLQLPSNNQYLFILSPPYSGSTLLYKLIGTSPHVSKFTFEGQFLVGVKSFFRKDPWNKNLKIPWNLVKLLWLIKWDLNKKFLAEKSPPHILRGKTIEKKFQPAHFITLIRNPYAFIEGMKRRQNLSIQKATAFWIKCAYFQRYNLENLTSNVFLSYEELVENPEEAKNKILKYLPGLETMNIEEDFNLKSIEGRKASSIKNLNSTKINELSSEELRTINKHLKEEEALLRYFNYELIEK